MARRASTFTTFLNVEEAKTVDPAFAALERKATASFNRIAQAANRASAASAGGKVAGALGGGPAPGQVAAAAAAERTRAQAIQGSVRAQREAAASSERLASKHILESNAARAAAASTTQLERALRLTSIAANVAQGPLGPVAGRISAIAVAVRELAGIQLGAVGALAVIGSFARAADSAAELKNQLRPLYETQQQVNSAFLEARRIADNARVGLEPVVSLYSRLTLAGRDAGLSQERVARITELASKAARLSGGPASSQAAGLYQFSQGLGSGTLSGDELKSVKENSLRLAKALAEGFQNADGTIGTTIAKLKELGAQGKLTPEVVASALERSGAKIDAELEKLPATISSSVAKLNNAFTVMINGGDEAAGVTRTLGAGLNLLADNLGTVTRASLFLVTTWAALRASSFAQDQAKRISGWKAEQAATRAATAEAARNANTARTVALSARQAAAQEVAGLRMRRAALQQVVAQEKEAAQAARATAIANSRKYNQPGFVGSRSDQAELTRAATTATARYNEAQARLTATTTQLRTATGQLQTTTVGYRGAVTAATTAQNAAAAASRTFGAAVKGLIAQVNLVGLALSFAVSWLIQFATQQDAASAAADRMAERQANLAKFVDLTTGRLIEQNKTLRANQIEAMKSEAVDANQQYRAARVQLTNKGQEAGILGQGLAGQGLPPQVRAKLREYASGRIPISEVTKFLDSNKFDPKYAKQIAGVRSDAAAIVTLAQNTQSALAGAKSLEGRAKPSDLAVARGDFSGAQSLRREESAPARAARKSAELEAIAAQRAARTPVERARADLQTTRAQRSAIIARDGEEAYLQQLETNLSAVKAASAAAKELGKSRTAAGVAARKAERDAVQDRKDSLSDNTNAKLLALQKNAPNISGEEFRKQRRDILASYDAEMSKIDASAAASHRASAQAIADEKARQAEMEKGSNQRRDILSSYGDTRALDNAIEAMAKLQELVGTELEEGLYTQAMADGDKRRVYEGLRRPITEAIEEQRRGNEVAQLRLQGYDLEANVLERMLQLQRDTGAVTRADLETALAQERVNERINDALESRQRQTSQILGVAQQTRDAFETMLLGFQKNPLKSIKGFFNSVVQNALQIRARQLTERIFAGADEKLRDLVKGSNGVDQAAEILAKSVKDTADKFTPLAAANDNLKSSAERAADALDKLANTASGTAGATSGGIAGLDVGGGAAPSSSGSYVDPDGSIVVVKTRDAKPPIASSAPIPTAGVTYQELFTGIGETLDKTFKSGNFFKGIGGGVSTALEGAGTGAMAGGALKMLGLKSSSSGSALGGALGNFIPGLPPGVGAAIGGVVGGLLGGLFKKTKKGYADNIMVGADGGAAFTLAGNSTSRKTAASDSANSLVSSLQNIAEQLGGGLATGVNLGSLGMRKDKYTFDPTPGESSGRQEFASAEEAAAAAMSYALEKGVITGISAASQKILRSGQDMQRALEKASVIESIPKRLKQMTDPVGAAIDELNLEFTKMISYLKEGGATASQFADAQKLYDLQRAEAIKQASDASVEALQQYIDEMKGGSSSPFNKRTTYENAAQALSAYRADVGAGKVVDNDEFLRAVDNFKEASRELNGSGSAFFSDVGDILNLVTRAKENVAANSSTSLPASPFDTTAVQQAINTQVQATEAQTSELGGKLDRIVDALRVLGYGGAIGSLNNLPGFRQAA